MKKNYKINLKEIGKRLRSVRNRLDLTIEKMHEITGFSKSLISDAENGSKKPSTIYLFELLHNFDVSIDYIFTGRGKMFLPYKDETDDQPVEIKSDYDEMFYLIENVDMVKYAMLSSFLNFRTQNKSCINRMLEEKNKNYRI